MAPINHNFGFTTKTWYTFEEAVEYMKLMDKNPTGRPISWRDRNGNPVAIGCNTK